MIITVSAVFLLVLLLSYFCPLITDDLHFKFIWNGFNADTGNEVRVSSIGDIFESAKNYYRFSGGRVICHFIVFAMVNLNKWVFAILNAAVFVAAGWLIFSHIEIRDESAKKWIFPMVYLTVFMLMPSMGDSVFWISGSVNYLWSGTAMLWAICLIDSKDVSRRNRYLTCIAVLIASAANEIFGGMLAIILILRYLAYRIKPASYYYQALFCVIPGMGLVLSAPGNANRMAAVDGHKSVSILDALKTAYSYLGSFIDRASPMLFLAIALLIYMILRKKKAADIIAPETVTIACIAGTCALGFSGVVIQRALFSVILPLLIPFWVHLRFLLNKACKAERAKAAAGAVIVLAVLQCATMQFMQAGITLLLLLLVVIINKLSHGSLSGVRNASCKE